jgi:hypothetical protein
MSYLEQDFPSRFIYSKPAQMIRDYGGCSDLTSAAIVLWGLLLIATLIPWVIWSIYNHVGWALAAVVVTLLVVGIAVFSQPSDKVFFNYRNGEPMVKYMEQDGKIEIFPRSVNYNPLDGTVLQDITGDAARRYIHQIEGEKVVISAKPSPNPEQVNKQLPSLPVLPSVTSVPGTPPSDPCQEARNRVTKLIRQIQNQPGVDPQFVVQAKQLDTELQKLALGYDDYHYTYERARLNVALDYGTEEQIPHNHAAFKLLYIATAQAISQSHARELLELIKADQGDDLWRLSNGHTNQWQPVINALYFRNIHQLDGLLPVLKG